LSAYARDDRWAGPAGGGLLLLAQPQRRAPRPPSRRLCRDPPGRKPGSPMCCAVSPIPRPPASTNSCPETGRPGLPKWRHEPDRKQCCIRQL
jgi:hypothetical protein